MGSGTVSITSPTWWNKSSNIHLTNSTLSMLTDDVCDINDIRGGALQRNKMTEMTTDSSSLEVRYEVDHEIVLDSSSDVFTRAAPNGCLECKHFRGLPGEVGVDTTEVAVSSCLLHHGSGDGGKVT